MGKSEFIIRLAEQYGIGGVGLQWFASEQYALEHPDDLDVPELRRRMAEQKQEYLRWGRDTLGWALYLFRKTA